jgi:ketosteroid isomerase-like protein
LYDVSNDLEKSQTLRNDSIRSPINSEYRSDRQTLSISKLSIKDRNRPLRDSGGSTQSIDSLPDLSKTQVNINSRSLYTKYLDRWADSWSRQDIETYLSFYSPDFVPESGENRSVWDLERRHRLKKNYLYIVSTRVLEVVPEGDNVIIEFEQSYKSSRLNSVSKKIITLVQGIGGWKIIRERVISESSDDSRAVALRLLKAEGTR